MPKALLPCEPLLGLGNRKTISATDRCASMCTASHWTWLEVLAAIPWEAQLCSVRDWGCLTNDFGCIPSMFYVFFVRLACSDNFEGNLLRPFKTCYIHVMPTLLVGRERERDTRNWCHSVSWLSEPEAPQPSPAMPPDPAVNRVRCNVQDWQWPSGVAASARIMILRAH